MRVEEEKRIVLEIFTTNINNEAQADRDGGENENAGIKDIVKNREAEAKEKDNVIAEGWQADDEKERKEEVVKRIEEQLVEERGSLREEEEGSRHQDKRLIHKEDKISGEFATKKEKDQLRLREKSKGGEKQEGKDTDRYQKEEDKTRRKILGENDGELQGLRKKINNDSDKEDDIDRDERNVQREEDKRRRELLWKKDEEQHRLRKEKKRLEEEEIRWTKREH